MPMPTFPVSASTYRVLVFIAKLPPVVFEEGMVEVAVTVQSSSKVVAVVVPTKTATAPSAIEEVSL